jgi:hypothetical protein
MRRFETKNKARQCTWGIRLLCLENSSAAPVSVTPTFPRAVAAAGSLPLVAQASACVGLGPRLRKLVPNDAEGRGRPGGVFPSLLPVT